MKKIVLFLTLCISFLMGYSMKETKDDFTGEKIYNLTIKISDIQTFFILTEKTDKTFALKLHASIWMGRETDMSEKESLIFKIDDKDLLNSQGS